MIYRNHLNTSSDIDKTHINNLYCRCRAPLSLWLTRDLRPKSGERYILQVVVIAEVRVVRGGGHVCNLSSLDIWKQAAQLSVADPLYDPVAQCYFS